MVKILDNRKVLYLIACLAEECGEVTQVAGKALRFGVFDDDEGKRETNLHNMRLEVHDVMAVAMMLDQELYEHSEESIISELDAELIKQKVDKVNNHYNAL